MCRERASRTANRLLRLILLTHLIAVAVVIDPLPAEASADSPKSTPAQKSAQRNDRPFPTPMIQREEVRFIIFDLDVEEHGSGGWRPARGLKKDQITLHVGSKRMPLDLFENRCGGTSASPPESARASTDSGAAAATGAVEGAAADPASAGKEIVRYILYFEEMHLSFADWLRSFNAALDWAATTARSSDEAMIVLGGYGLRIFRPMLPVSHHLKEDIEAAKADFSSTDMWGNQEDGRIQDVKDAPSFHAAQALADAYSAEAFMRARRSLENMASLMGLFEKVEGTKNLILFSDKLRYLPGSVYPFATDPTPTYEDLRQVAAAANERDVRIYAVQARGLEVEPFPDELMGAKNPHEDRADDALTMLASETGGRVVERMNRLGVVFDRVSEDVACSYRAGFHFRPRYSGSAQRIEIRVSGPARGYRVRHRRSVDDPTRETMEADLLRAAMIDPAAAREFKVSVRAVPLYSDAASSRVRIEVSVNIADLLALPGAGSAAGARKLLVQVGGRIVPQRDRAGESLSSPERGAWADVDTNREALAFSGQAEITIPPRPSGQAGGVATLLRVVEVSAPAGTYRVVGVVEDRQAGTIAAGLADFRAGAEPAVLGPVGLLLEDPRSVLVHGGPEETAKEPPRRRSEKHVVFVDSELPTKAVIAPDGTIEGGRDAEVYYSVCGIPSGEGTLERLIACANGGDPVSLPPRPVPSPSAGEPCALIVERIPAASLSGDECEITVALASPGRAAVSRTLKLRVKRAGGGE